MTTEGSLARSLCLGLWRLISMPVMIPLLMLLIVADDLNTIQRIVERVWFITDKKEGEQR